MRPASHPIEMKALSTACAIGPKAPAWRSRSEFFATKPKFAPHHVERVLAQRRGRFERRLRGAWKLDWAARHPHGAGRAVLRCHHHVAREGTVDATAQP